MTNKKRHNGRVYLDRVMLAKQEDESYPSFYLRVDLARSWLQCHHNKKDWVQGWSSGSCLEFRFRNHGLATIFALKWT